MDTCFTTQQHRLEEAVFHAMQTRFWVGLSSSSATPAQGVSEGARDPGLTYQAPQALAIATGPSCQHPSQHFSVWSSRSKDLAFWVPETGGLGAAGNPLSCTWGKETQPQTGSDETQRARGGE